MEKRSDWLETSGLNDLADTVLGNPLWRLSIAAFPGLGPIVITLAEQAASKRLEKLCNALEASLKEVNYEMVSKAFLQSEEFGAIIMKTMRLSLENHNEMKIKLFARILAGAITRGQIDDLDDTAEFMGIADALRIEDMFVLNEIVVAYEQGKVSGEQDDLLIMQPINLPERLKVTEITPEQIEVSLLRLASLALIRKVTSPSRDSMGDIYLPSGDVYAPSAYAQQFLTFIKDTVAYFSDIRDGRKRR